MTATRPPWLQSPFFPAISATMSHLWAISSRSGPHRSSAWFWRQVVFAVLAGPSQARRQPCANRNGWPEGWRPLAMFIVLSFQVVVAGSLLDDLIRRIDRAQMTRINHPEWLVFVVLLSLPVAWFIGRAMSRLHRRFSCCDGRGLRRECSGRRRGDRLGVEFGSRRILLSISCHFKPQRQWCLCSGCWSGVRAVLSLDRQA